MGMDLPYNPPVQQSINLFVLCQTKSGIEHLLKRLSRMQSVRFEGAPPPSIQKSSGFSQCLGSVEMALSLFSGGSYSSILVHLSG